MDKIINIKKANYLNEYKIAFEFNDGVKKTIDFEETKLFWDDDRMIEILTSYEDEERFILRRLNFMKADEFDKIFDEEAQHLGVSRQAIIKTWLADKLIQNKHHKIAV